MDARARRRRRRLHACIAMATAALPCVWQVLEMPTFLLGGTDPAGKHHGADLAAEVGYDLAKHGDPSMKAKLAIMAQRVLFDSGLFLFWVLGAF